MIRIIKKHTAAYRMEEGSDILLIIYFVVDSLFDFLKTNFQPLTRRKSICSANDFVGHF